MVSKYCSLCNHLCQGASLGRRFLNRDEDVEGIISLQSKGFYEPWDIEWLDTFFLKLFAVSSARDTVQQIHAGA